eukprot:CAMPEP_0172194476 /NCGR_PEP_ID=MMETSP1050-20130122/25602_1 /TAXON_ID=233186 /ORGANISM="Cryptomonas curvata, Strain CCAP979/52" /LENGTH=132 /DNA_ID=CAMNT_0012870289 /DNA_START=410 /DNA_END=809 /DNA_ORIENTATION=+
METYADGHPKAPLSRLSSFHSSKAPALPEHQEQSESASSDSSENTDGSEQPQLPAASPRVVLEAVLTAPARVPDIDDTDAGLIRRRVDSGQPLSMRSLAQLVSERDEHGRQDGLAANMGLLFTDAAHTVLER